MNRIAVGKKNAVVYHVYFITAGDEIAFGPGVSAIGTAAYYQIHSGPIAAVATFITSQYGPLSSGDNTGYAVHEITVLTVFLKIDLFQKNTPFKNDFG